MGSVADGQFEALALKMPLVADLKESRVTSISRDFDRWPASPQTFPGRSCPHHGGKTFALVSLVVL